MLIQKYIVFIHSIGYVYPGMYIHVYINYTVPLSQVIMSFDEYNLFILLYSRFFTVKSINIYHIKYTYHAYMALWKILTCTTKHKKVYADFFNHQMTCMHLWN